MVAEERAGIERRLAVLRVQQEDREEQRTKALLELDACDQRNYRNYWQARLDLALQHSTEDLACDPVVRSVLHAAGVPHLAPLFARHRVDAVVLRILTAEDLASMGVDAVGDRKRLLSAIAGVFLPPPSS
jgi:hypothetical protein